VLNDLVRDIEHGTIRDQQGSRVETLASEITSRNDQEPCRVTAPDRQPSSPANRRMRSVQLTALSRSWGPVAKTKTMAAKSRAWTRVAVLKRSV
jgi:hypothetical protein